VWFGTVRSEANPLGPTKKFNQHNNFRLPNLAAFSFMSVDRGCLLYHFPVCFWPAGTFLTREVVLTSYYRMRVFLTLQVTTAQDAHVMQFVSGNDVSQRANADIILVCLSVSQPLRFI